MKLAITRPANAADVPELITLMRRSWLETWAPELPPAATEIFNKLDPARAYAESKWQELIVAEMEGAVVGTLHVEKCWIRSIELCPEFKRRGIGSQLMDQAEYEIGLKYPAAQLEVRSFNKGAIEFYAQRGWIEVRRFEGTECGVPVETIEMTKILRKDSAS